jgi:hypothetical protein
LAAAAVPKSTVTTAGDVIYATGSAAVTRLALGTAGKVLTVNAGATAPEWATAASGGGMTLIATATPSAATTVSFTSIPSTYKHLMLIWRDVFQSVNNAFFYVRFNNDSGSFYTYQGFSLNNVTVGINWRETNGTGFGVSETRGAVIPQTTTSDSDLAQTAKGSMNIYRYTDTGNRLVEYSGTGYNSTNVTTYNSVKGIYSPTSGSAVSQIDFIRSSTQTITGTFYLYGVS